ncbi:hypothetical protein N9A94_00725 [Akkermansiaceae bacterium]|nr:hypothetical protein [Akkermansiaceae bacterium]MDA7887867.1 hypothetical protein [Akkermansiaceae bacterium]
MNQFKLNKCLPPGAVQMNVIGLLVVAVFSAVILGSLIAQGDFLTAYLGLLVLLGAVALQQLKASFWLFLPFAMVSQLPAISIIVASLTLGELWILASVVFVGLYWILEKRSLSPVLLGPGKWMYGYTIWALLVFAVNPVGLSFTGASEGGLRFYIKIILAFIAFLIIANSRIGEKNAKRIMVLLILGVFAETAFNLLGAFVPQVAFLTAKSAGGAANAAGFYGWQQLLAILPAVAIPFIFARFSLMDLIQPKKWWVLFTVLVLVAMVLFSGKRSLAVIVLLYPGMLAFIKGRRMIAISYGMAGAAGLLSLIAIQGLGVSLPLNTQRILSVIPGITGLDYKVAKSADNDFRETLNRYALEEIRERPLIGEGFKVDFEAIYFLENSPNLALGIDDHIEGAKYAETSNWHNTWLGISADFGIPAAVIFAFLMISYIWNSVRILRRLDKNSYQWTLVAGLLAIVLGELLRSWQFGHASLSYWAVSWKVGVLFAVDNWLRETAAEEEEAQIKREKELLQNTN